MLSVGHCAVANATCGNILGKLAARYRMRFILALNLFFLLCGGSLGIAHAGNVTPTPQNIRSAPQAVPVGTLIEWDPVVGATSYRVTLYRSLIGDEVLSQGSTDGTSFLTSPRCGSSIYFTVSAIGPDGTSAPSLRYFGQSIDCPYAVPDCTYAAVPISGAMSFSSTTVDQSNSINISDNNITCGDGKDPGTAGGGRDHVYRYNSPTDCTLTVKLTALDLEYNPILYVADTCAPYQCLYYSNEFAIPTETITFPVTANQDYFIFVDGYTSNSGGPYTISFITDDCPVAQNCDVFQEGFTSGDFPAGWTTINGDSIPNDGSYRYRPQSWNVVEEINGPLYNRVAMANAPADVLANTDDWLITPAITFGENAVLRWRDARIGGPTGNFLVNVYAGQSPSILSLIAGGPLLTLNLADVNETLTQREISLADLGLSNQTLHFAFYHFARGTGYFMIDDVGVCSEPTEVAEGEGEGDVENQTQSADQDGDFAINLSELLRVIQFYNSGAYHCAANPGDTEDGYIAGAGANQSCPPYDTDYSPQDWNINLSELLRAIQFYNSPGYRYCPGEGSEDGYCPLAL